MSEDAALGYEIMQLRLALVDLCSEMKPKVKLKKGRGEIIVLREEPHMLGEITIVYVNDIPIQVKFVHDTNLRTNKRDPDFPAKEYLFPFNQIAGIIWSKPRIK